MKTYGDIDKSTCKVTTSFLKSTQRYPFLPEETKLHVIYEHMYSLVVNNSKYKYALINYEQSQIKT